jgi:hypothetical protein
MDMELKRSRPLHSVNSPVRTGMMLLIVLASTACSSGGGGEESARPPATFVSVPFVLLDSIPAGAYRYNDEARVTVNGLPAALEDLQYGEIAMVVGRRQYRDGQSDGVGIESIDVRHLVIGPVESIDSDHARLAVMGQTVIVTGGTVVADVPVSAGGLDAVRPNDAVAVSGFLNASGELIATRIARQASGHDVLLRGLVAASDPAVSRFRVGGLDVYYGQADIDLQDFPGGAPAVGDQVLLRANTAPTDALLDASAVAFVPRTLGAPTDADVELTGAITRYGSSADFDVAGVTVNLDCSGADCWNDPRLLLPNAIVRVYGKSDNNRDVHAGSIIFIGDGGV